MKLDNSDLHQLCDTAKLAAREAGKLISLYAQKKYAVFTKPEGSSEASQVLTEVDLQCEELILKHLSESIRTYDLALLSEETEDDKQRLVKDYFWCIDPLDGTLAFTKAKPGYAVSIALVSKAGESIIGVVYDPVRDRMYSAIKGQGAYLNKQIWQPLSKKTRTSQNHLTLPCDRSLISRPDYPHIKKALIDKLSKGSLAKLNLNALNEKHHAGAVINACHTLEAPPACYFKAPKREAGGGSIWDVAATSCIYLEVGGFVCDFEGKPLALNRHDTTFMNHSGIIFATEKALVTLVQSLPIGNI